MKRSVIVPSSPCDAGSGLTPVLTILAWTALVLVGVLPAGAVPIVNDPNGFHGITWGASLAELPQLTLAEPGERVTGYEFKDGPPMLGEAKVESLRLSSVGGQFARVTIRYRGQATHEVILSYLQSEYGPLDRTPGSMARGLNQQFTWRGSDTEINLTYEARGERGFVFFESRVLAPRLQDVLTDIGVGY